MIYDLKEINIIFKTNKHDLIIKSLLNVLLYIIFSTIKKLNFYLFF